MAFSHLIEQKAFYHDFQPIFDLTDEQTVGYEALFRSGAYANPESAYHHAIESNLLYELDISSIDAAVHSFLNAQADVRNKKLFVNAYPSTILHPEFTERMIEILNRFPAGRQSLVLEIIESEEIKNFKRLGEVVRTLKQKGLLIAVDDFGKGGDNINRTIEVDADYIKLDRYFSIDLLLSEKKQAYVSFIVQYCAQFNIKAILEGLEKEEDIKRAKGLGIHYAQGNLLGKPQQVDDICECDP
ncbi:EAL domain-containing protein [Sporolactobacillus spathodeae]|uniref:EAL domain-containing protein (Putative c-di-GMP-specific phosphodiesterase class I) n=1 Tax=Sporolactobacillus spathodeae TaxID=1465502 RepID=A0ABS2Q769_9BACL|nr:EAL domain-containing protein [Sporolactobacillus spathodeae]MBM7657255.1 EAL domain-containing protein (putative c-di-GMP-specific phosphodiesterase class I) [Sporolactobacillus spathodeae]